MAYGPRVAKRIGILTGGGDCPGLNAAIRAVVKHAAEVHDFEVVGICDAFRGLYDGETMVLDPASVRGILDRGGTILGSSNKANPFAYSVKGEDGSASIEDVSVTVGGSQCTLTSMSATSLECLTPAGELGAQPLVVTSGGLSASGPDYTYAADSTPVITAVSRSVECATSESRQLLLFVLL